jgi:hypothetical protein
VAPLCVRQPDAAATQAFAAWSNVTFGRSRWARASNATATATGNLSPSFGNASGSSTAAAAAAGPDCGQGALCNWPPHVTVLGSEAELAAALVATPFSLGYGTAIAANGWGLQAVDVILERGDVATGSGDGVGQRQGCPSPPTLGATWQACGSPLLTTKSSRGLSRAGSWPMAVVRYVGGKGPRARENRTCAGGHMFLWEGKKKRSDAGLPLRLKPHMIPLGACPPNALTFAIMLLSVPLA